MEDTGEPHYANFVSVNCQRTSLSMTTPFNIAKSLSKIYPFLIIVDNILNNILWIHDDSQLLFVNIVLTVLSLRYLLTSSVLKLFNAESMFLDYLGLLSTVALLCSIGYYFNSVIAELQTQDPPTLDDVFILLDNIQSKLDIIKYEMRNLIDVYNASTLYKWLTLSTLIQLLIFKFHIVPFVKIPKDYIIVSFIIFSYLHSKSCQGMLRLIWRLKHIRMLYNCWRGTSDPFHTKQFINSDRYFYIKILNNDYVKVNLTITTSLELTEIDVLRSKLKELFDNNSSEMSECQNQSLAPPTICFNIMEIKIYENERKWNHSNWKPILLPSDRSNFVTSDSYYNNYICHNPIYFDTHVPAGWIALDDAWNTSNWIYSDGNWNKLGSKDTIECFTRSRIWTKRLFQRNSN